MIPINIVQFCDDPVILLPAHPASFAHNFVSHALSQNIHFSENQPPKIFKF